MEYIDSHCHLDFSAFDEDRDQVVARTTASGVGLLVVPSTTPESWPNVLALAERYPCVRIALGLHPYFLGNVEYSALDELRDLVKSERSRIVAIGETGLDRMIDVDYGRQQKFFERQVRIAEEFSLPVIVHSRKANDQVASILRQSAVTDGVVHGFSGSYQQAIAFWNIGMRIGVGGVITYERAQKTRKTIASLPTESLVLETDAPDMPLCGRQGKRNSPEYLSEVFHSLEKIRSEGRHQLRKQLIQNTLKLFSLSDSC
ncbi:TatD family hydrolase [Hahella ganghwensis]|uniref:TatD family hydrolase n=1 Tax=Hahella ganghwensis TaxID=286420 RepID=UPI000368B0AB|nr:TatD family hydrolase [Hahella ganghwensis]